MSDELDDILPFQKTWPGFVEHAREIFTEADVDPVLNPEAFDKVIDTLARKMATLSRTMGLSMERAHAYDAQKRVLVEELRRAKATGTVKTATPIVVN
jgi:hypothetical protein